MLANVRDFPEELIGPIKALTDETRRRILLSLLQSSISYSEIQNIFQIKKGTLNHHLHILVSSGMVRNFSIESPGNPYKSYYAITDFGRKFMDGIRQTLEPKLVRRRTVTSTTSTTVTDEMIIESASEGEEQQTMEVLVRS